MSTINRADVVAQLARRFGTRGGSLDLELGEGIAPVAVLGNLDDPPYASKNGGFAAASVAATAGSYTKVFVRAAMGAGSPPSPLGLVTCIRQVFVMNDTAGALSYAIDYGQAIDQWTNIGTVDFGVQPSWQYARRTGSHVMTDARATATNDFAFVGTMLIRVPANDFRVVNFTPGGLLLGRETPNDPEAIICVRGAVVNQAVNAGFLWDEYDLR